MKTIFKHLILYCFLFTGAVIYGQQQNSYTFYRQNMNIVNPAYAGADSLTTVIQTHKTQWMGIENAPFSQAFSFGTSVGKKVGLGLTVENDRTFIEKQTFVNIDFSYMVPLEENLLLFMGLKAGGNFYSLNTDGIQTGNYEIDPSLQNMSLFNPNIGIGFLLKHKKFYLSLSAPKILETKRAKEEKKAVTTAADRVHAYFSGGYDLLLSDALSLKPSAMVRYVDGAPLSMEFTTLFDINENLELGGAYSTDETMSALALIDVLSWFNFGYAYQKSFRKNLQKVNNGTHEIVLRFRL